MLSWGCGTDFEFVCDHDTIFLGGYIGKSFVDGMGEGGRHPGPRPLCMSILILLLLCCAVTLNCQPDKMGVKKHLNCAKINVVK